jgi:hypothetical protein
MLRPTTQRSGVDDSIEVLVVRGVEFRRSEARARERSGEGGSIDRLDEFDGGAEGSDCFLLAFF